MPSTTMHDGFKTTFVGTLLSGSIMGVQLVVISFTPPNVMAGGAIDGVNMGITRIRPKYPKKLISIGQAKATVEYDPAVYLTLVAQLGQLQQFTVTFPNTTTRSFWGWVDDFTPGESSADTRPTATLTLECSGQDSAGNEVGIT